MAIYNRKDSYYKMAKREGYLSRAAYKLKELNGRFKAVKRGYKILDCGAAPGGWSQVALEAVGPQGLVVAVDLNPIKGVNAPNFINITGDFTSEEVLAEILKVSPVFDAVISDMAPHTTGIRDADHLRSVDLVLQVYDFTRKVLREGGDFVFKIFEGSERRSVTETIRKNFRDFKITRPEATRNGSMETYAAALGFLKKEDF